MSEVYPQERKIIPCCIHLQTKTRFCVGEEMAAGPGFIKVTDTGTYWCEKTSESFGPDDQPGTPEACQPGRVCYERKD